MVKYIAKVNRLFLTTLDFITPFADLLARLWIAKIFFQAGLTKIASWNATVILFTDVYHVPLLPPSVAASLATTAELILPILLILGLGGRFIVFIFFMYNLIAVMSYDFLWTVEGMAGLEQHVNWGLLLMLLMCHGSGKFSIDYWLNKRHGYRSQ